MSEIDSDGRPRDRSALAVVLAVVFLAVLGASVGVILGTTRGGEGSGGNAGGQSSPDVTVTETRTATEEPTRTRSASPSATRSYRPTTRDDCPQQTDEAARVELTVKRYIKTRNSEVWICEGGGRTVYQGHLRGKPFPSATSDYTLYLTDVRYEAGVWAATNGTTVYYVHNDKLRVERDGRETANEPVEDLYEV
jgi:hypothetical protein